MQWRIWRVPLILAIACFALSWSLVQIKRQGVILQGRYHLGTGDFVFPGAVERPPAAVLLEEMKGTSLIPPEIENPNWLKVFAYHGIEHAETDFTPTFRKYPPNALRIMGGLMEWDSFSFWAPLREHVKMTAVLPHIEGKEWDVDCEGTFVLAWCIRDRWFGLGEGVHWEMNREGELQPIYATGILYGVTDRWSPNIHIDIGAWMQPQGVELSGHLIGSRPQTIPHWLKAGRAKLQCPAYVPLFLLLYGAVMLGYLLWRPVLHAFRLRRR